MMGTPAAYGGYNMNQGYQNQMQNSQPFQQNSQPGTPAKTQKNNTLRHVTIKQILEGTPPFPDAPLLVDNKELAQVVICGRIFKTKTMSNATVCTIDDGTGMIDVKKFSDLEDEGAAQDELSLVDGLYVKVVGKVKNFQGRKSLDVLNIKAVDSMDEVTHHLLTTIYTHLALTRPKPSKMNYKAGEFAGSFGLNDSAIDPNLGALTKQILIILHQAADLSMGISGDDIVYKLRGAAADSEIRQELTAMCEDGLAYETEHGSYKATAQA